MEINYFQNHVVTITYDEELRLGSAVWKGFLSSEEFRGAISTCVQMMEEYKILRWLGDNRKMRVIRQADQEWFIENILPRLQHSTLRRNAVLVSEDFFNKTAVEQIYKRAEGLSDLVTKDFNNKVLAMGWLKQPF
ncbi:hypothetical protein POKO110462_00390 [Pontibacter korlensis]|uniref:STAS/SEC14 domain-containing protein n=1 Tax=Pontibacter korlensis TaxID=400092 RepID=A0A0E3ZE84_9BACT|nr:hypothetical protein [Pontibacter korlensis]AKD02740.1 hypothetical protein PKOR_05920 [Pontibacter korlensis]